jgi:uncharacterized protein YjbI with pentapeptide repeats
VGDSTLHLFVRRLGLFVLALTVVLPLTVLLIRAARSRAWTGIDDKTLWDWMQLMIVPFVLIVGGFLLTTVQDNRQRDIEDQRGQDAAFQAYLDQMSQLLLNRNLRASKGGSEVRTLARARTLTVLERFDEDRKARVLTFLYEANLIRGPDPVINLDGADLRSVNLSSGGEVVKNLLGGWSWTATTFAHTRTSWRDINLSGADLRDSFLSSIDMSAADLSKTDLTGATLDFANLSRANLEGAFVTEEQLQGTCSLQGAIMPDGSRHPQQKKGPLDICRQVYGGNSSRLMTNSGKAR